MNDLTQVDTTNATEVDSVEPITVTVSSLFAAASKSLQKQFLSALNAADDIDAQYAAIQAARADVAIALEGSGDFDAAGKAFKAANNKLDKLINGRDAVIDSAQQGIAAMRKLLNMMEADLAKLEN